MNRPLKLHSTNTRGFHVALTKCGMVLTHDEFHIADNDGEVTCKRCKAILNAKEK